MIEVEIRNFQSIAQASLKIEGYTVVTGRSNIGKSAIVRALSCALTGERGTDFVRHDPDSCPRILRGVKKCSCFSSVSLKFPDGSKVLWEKGDSVNQYTTWVNGEKSVYSKVGLSPELPPMLQGFSEVKVGDDKSLLQVADQWHPIFLLNHSGNVVADVLSDVAQLDDINTAMRMVTKDRKEAKSTRKVREKDIQTLEKDLQKYTGLDVTVEKAQGLAALQRSVQGVSHRLAAIEGYIVRATTTQGDLHQIKQALEPSLPEGDLQEYWARVSRVGRWYVNFSSASQTIASAERALAQPIPDFQEVESASNRLATVSKLHKDLATKLPVYKALSGVSGLTLPDVESLRSKADLLKAVCGWTDRLYEIKQAVSTQRSLEQLALEDRPLADARSLASRLETLDKLASLLTELDSTIAATSSELDIAEKEESDILAEFEALGACPSCSQPISPGHVV